MTGPTAVARGRTGLLVNLPAYAKIVALTTQLAFTYRLNLALELLGLMLQIFLLKVVWTAVYADRGSVEGADLTTLLTYLTIANLQIWIISPSTSWLIQEKVREGKIAQDLARPVGLVGQILANQVGFTLGLLPLIFAVTPVAYFVGVLRPPATLEAALFYVVSVLLAYVVVTWMGMLIGLISFWTLETTGIGAIYRFSNLFFSGALVPLWLFPGPLRAVAELLPFQTQAFIPVSIYIGRIDGADALRGILIQVVWAIALGLVVRLVWSRALRKVVIQGG